MRDSTQTKLPQSPKGRSKFWWILVPLACVCVGVFFHRSREHNEIQDEGIPPTAATRTSAAEMHRFPKYLVECVPPSINEFPRDLFTQEERQSGFVVLHIIVTAYLCLILAVVCDQYFVPSLEIIAESLQVPADVAGATFMAIGTSSPELYSAVIGSFITEGDIGIGTIVGSAVFNILGVTSVTGLLLWRTEAPVDWYPVSRDCLVYIFSVTMLICVIQDNIVTWFEAALLLTMFAMYIAVMYFNHNIKESCEGTFQDLRTWWKQYRRARTTSFRQRRSRSTSRKPHRSTIEALDPDTQEPFIPSKDSYNIAEDNNTDDSDSDDDMSPWTVPSESWFQLVLWFVMWPVLVVLSLTIPNCRKPKQAMFPYTFLSSVIWIGVLSYGCSWMVTIIGHTFQLPDSVAGITILAAGISVPEIIASVIVVKNGMANMAISNLIGSNIFDILFCLGMPWLIKTLLSSSGKLVINSAALTYTTATLLSTVVLLFVTLGAAGWKLNWKVGLMCLCLYALFLVIACLCELNYFGDMNPPACTS